MDLSSSAIEAAKARLGARCHLVRWLVADATETTFATGSYDFWHDRAVFHFLVEPALRRRYVAAVRNAVRPDGHIVVATFGPNGPKS